ncbi:MAG: NapC/NirT family cytochrome c [Alcaligenaceae bacterium]
MNNERKGLLKSIWSVLRTPSAKYSILTIFSVSFFAGIIFWGGFNTGMEMTNSLEFCITCHEMRDTVYQEYKETIHYSNRTGVRAICSDCHVPKDWVHKIIRKSQASLEVWGKITGSIDTKEKFEAKRMELATHEWKRMAASNSRECRNCHSFEAMSGELQKQTPYKKHMKAKEEGKTCIDCHKGIAHQLPKEYEEPD